ncbi:hypothetical protein GCM10007875_23610 [Limnobacter litoralis]|uniref:Uncharacterized protein n=1 Tax=Limnobacter litoralis TaxID=481366 RepID=A0ABQ5YV12_9BURK|nr:hypothetical protein GCM10007875_23610 [Limnobacter litoralis]
MLSPEDVCEVREFFCPGFRMYYVRRGDKLIVMLGGGDKSITIFYVGVEAQLS